MKLLFVSDFDYDPNSGAAGSLITIGDNLQKIGCTVKYVWRRRRKFVQSNNYSRFFELPVIQYNQIKEALAEEHFDVIIISQPHAWLAAKRLKKLYPKVLFVNRTHGWELRLAVGSLSNKLGLFKTMTKKLVIQLLKHCSYLTVKYCDAVICASSDDANYIKKDYPQYKDKILTISYGLDNSYVGIKLHGQKNNIVNFLFAGQYLPRKGIYDIQSAFKQLVSRMNEFTVTFIIHEGLIPKAHQDFDFLDQNSLQVKPWVSRLELIDIYLDNDVFLMPSYGEGFGKSTLEAMACGLCVIGYTEGALTDFGKNKSNALISDMGDKSGLLANVKYALDNPDAVRNYGRQAYADVQAQTWEAHALRTKKLLEGLMEV